MIRSNSSLRHLLTLMTLMAAMAFLVSCVGKHSGAAPQVYGDKPEKTSGEPAKTESSAEEEKATPERPLAYNFDKDKNKDRKDSEKPAEKVTAVESTKPKPISPSRRSAAKESEGSWLESTADHGSFALHEQYALGENEDSASAVDDDVWRMFDLAEEYHSMGVVANREASWEEAQYYFEKAIKILASLDIEPDTVVTPEAVKYTTLLSNTIADYRVALRSLGQLEGEVTPYVMVERYGELEERLGHDSMVVFSQEVKPITYDLPVKMNDRVKSSVIYFQTVAKEQFKKYLRRSQRYDALYRETIRKYGLPEDLVYLSLVESGFNPNAYSWARAMGLWQFISSTGRSYGLNRNWWIDERKDPVKATDAACRFLRDLYKQFGDWELAMAAYNGGPGRVSRTIKKQGTIDFWKMKLKRQTMDYVPLIYAAAIISKDPERYGFYDIVHESPVVWDEVKIDKCLELKVVAKEIGCDVKTLKNLNPELLRNYTPPNDKKYQLKIPVGSKPKFLAAYDGMPSPKETSWVQHKIRKGETVSTIAAKYGVSQYAVFESNNLSRRSRIYAGKKLIVPVPLDREYSSKSAKRDYRAENSIYTIRSGDNLWDLARVFGTSVDALRRVNYIERGSRIYVGQRLKIPSSASRFKELNSSSSGKTYASNQSSAKSSSSGDTSKYKVRSGDTLWDIARKFGTTTSKLRNLNGLGRSSRIYPGQVLTVAGGGGSEYVIYKVRRGDNLSRIAKKYRTTIARILAANHLTDPDNIPVGYKLRINVK
ncbi:MAG: LysM peptidoglycan-binding domain-containing protein [bacterium]|nr:LysM peptidoglycan-binding domain-containing protein [bacterium]